jgi:glycosyltransferase involved in cell wall biosynthesis
MLLAIGRGARARGRDAVYGFTPIARGRSWLSDFQAEGFEVRFLPADDEDRQARDWIAAWLAEIVGGAVVHTQFTHLDVPALNAARGRPRTPVFWHVHTFLPSRPLRMAVATVKYGVVGRRTAGIICVTDEVARAVRHRGGSGRRTVVLENGIDIRRFAPQGPQARTRAREELGLPADSTLLLHFSWNWEMKGGPLFAETVAAMRAAGVEVIGVSVGGGDAALAAAERLGIGGGMLAIPQVKDSRVLYAAADAIAATSAAEGGPYAMLEALASGLAVVASDIPAHRLPVSAGVRLAPLEASPLAAAATELLGRSAEQRSADAQAARDWVVRERGLDGYIDRLFGLYDAALGS